MTILVDLSILRHPYCGLGQVAGSYGRWYAQHPEAIPADCEVTLLVPKEYVGAFGSAVRYLVARDVYRYIPALMPHFDLWHSIHQLSPFRPASPSTRHILTIHDLNFLYEKYGAKRRKYLRRLQRECDAASQLCFISRYAQSDAVSHLSLGDIPQRVIYNGVSDLTDGPQQPVDGLNATQPFLLAIGVVRPKKNLHTLLPMMDLLPDYQLVIAGDDSGPYSLSLRQQLPRHPNVHITGRVSDAQRRWLYSHCAALLFPSLAEGFGLPVVEAMQWGKPVFCSRLTSLPEIGASHAFYFDDFQPESMAYVLEQGMAAFTRQAADNERQYAATFSMENHMRQYWKLYEEVLKS